MTHCLPFTIATTLSLLTLYFLAKNLNDPGIGPSLGLWPLAFPRLRGMYSALIRAASSGVILRCLFLHLAPVAPRPLRIRSSALSLWVPVKRWSGRTHLGLSQWWHTRREGHRFFVNNHATRCVPRFLFLPSNFTENEPYCSLLFRFPHSQQPSDFCTLDQNLSWVPFNNEKVISIEGLYQTGGVPFLSI